MENWLVPHAPADLPAAERVLVLAPHPDDETFGCAGALHGYAQRGAWLHVHVLTDGAGYAPEHERSSMAATRMAETNAALAVLGVADASNGGFADRSLIGNSRLAPHLKGLLEQHRPDLVLAPAPSEVHPDHRAAIWALQGLLAYCTERPAVLLYEVGALQRPNFLLDITPVWPFKQAAMQCFASQLQQQDYAAHIEALNRYRSYTLGPAVRYAEAYTWLPASAGADLQAQASLDPYEWQPWLRRAFALAEAQAETQQLQLLAQQRLLEQMQQQLSLSQGQLSQSQAQISQSQAQISQSQAQISQSLRVQTDLHLARQQLQQQHDALVRELRAVLGSKSWYVTRPLRWLAHQLRRLFGRKH